MWEELQGVVDGSIAHRPRVLILLSHYLPGFKSGGPVQSIKGLVDHLNDEFDFFIVCQDRDLGDSQRYPGIEVDQWITVDGTRVMYLSGRGLGPTVAAQVLRSVRPQVVYLNTLFRLGYTVLPLLARKWISPFPTIILAPRGSLSSEALAIKPWKKLPFFAVARLVRLFSDVIWHATSPRESEDIRRKFGRKVRIVYAPDLSPPAPSGSLSHSRPPKRPGALRLVFLSRISPIKNLDLVLRLLSGVRGDVLLTIAGPVGDGAYWEKCKAEFEHLPANVEVRVLGPVPHAEVMACLENHHLFFLPSLSENHGHVICEALLAGTPVLIGDQTPWRDLHQKKAGWDLPLSKPAAFAKVLERCVEMSQDEFEEMSESARRLGQRAVLDPDGIDQNRSLLREAIRRSGEVSAKG